MGLINGYELMNEAKKNGNILPAFNTTNLELTFGIAKGLKDSNYPGYVQISSNNLRLSNAKTIAELTKNAVKKYDIKAALHLDHGSSFEDVQECIKAGFTSIMYDGSKYDYEENIRRTKEVADYCHKFNIPIEAELGSIGGSEDDLKEESERKTNPDLVFDFINRTSCDLLAVSIGNVHGLDVRPNIDLSLLEKINNNATVPLVLHGGSGIPLDIIIKAKKFGLLKINYGADIRKQFIKTFGLAYEQNPNIFDVIEISLNSVENVSKEVNNLTREINK